LLHFYILYFILLYEYPGVRGGTPHGASGAADVPAFSRVVEAKRKDEVEDALLDAACYRQRNWTTTPVGLPAIHDHHYPRTNDDDERLGLDR
jgi:hypothetical protein